MSVEVYSVKNFDVRLSKTDFRKQTAETVGGCQKTDGKNSRELSNLRNAKKLSCETLSVRLSFVFGRL